MKNKLLKIIKSMVFTILYYTGIPLIIRELIQRKKVTILCFHEVSLDIADRTFRYFSDNYNIISLRTFLDEYENNQLNNLPPKSLIITFDDGYKSNYNLLPIFRKYNIVATIFVCSQIIGTKRGYWWNHNSTGYSRDQLKNMPDEERKDILLRFGYDYKNEYKEPETLSVLEIKEMHSNFDFQSHTRTHPILTNCNDNECWGEIWRSKEELQELLKTEIYAFSFPNGNYRLRELEFVQKAEYKCALITAKGFNNHTSNIFLLKRNVVGNGFDYYEIVLKATLYALLFKK